MKTNYNIVLLFSIIFCIGFGLISSDLMKFAFAQSDENVMNQTDSENIVGLNATSAAGLNATSAAGLNATSAAGLNATLTPIPTTSESYPIEYIIAGLAIIVIGISIAIALSRKKKITSTKKGSTSKKFCRKCGSTINPKSKFCGKCGVSC